MATAKPPKPSPMFDKNLKYAEIVFLRPHAGAQKSCDNFFQAYRELPRNSGRCQALYAQVAKCAGLLDYVLKKAGENINFSKDLFERKFIDERRNKREREGVEEIDLCIQKAVEYLIAFTDIRENYIQLYNGEHAEVQARMEIDFRTRRYLAIADDLEKSVEAWELYLRQNVEGAALNEFEAIVSAKRDKLITEKPVLKFTYNLIRELNTELQKKDDNEVNWERLQTIYMPIKDIYRALKHEAIKQMLDAAEARGVKVERKLDQSVRLENHRDTAFIKSFGPFGIGSVDKRWKWIFNLEQTADTNTYSVDLSRNLPKSVSAGKRVTTTARTSGISELTIKDPTTRARMKIPENSAFYQFVYPCSDQVDVDILEASDNELGFLVATKGLLTYGGYAYYNSNKQLIKLNGLTKREPDLYFSGPYELSDAQKGVVETAQELDRFMPVAESDLKKEGVAHFAWFKPGELGEKNHGSFVFLSEEEGNAPVYFNIINFAMGSKLAAQAQAENNTSAENLQELLKSYRPVAGK